MASAPGGLIRAVKALLATTKEPSNAPAGSWSPPCPTLCCTADPLSLSNEALDMFPQAGTHKPLYTRLSWRRQQQCHQQRDDKTHERHQQQRGHQQDSCWCTHHTIHEHKQTQEQEETQEHQQHDQHNHWHAQPQEQQSQQGGVTSEQELRQVIREELHKELAAEYELKEMETESDCVARIAAVERSCTIKIADLAHKHHMGQERIKVIVKDKFRSLRKVSQQEVAAAYKAGYSAGCRATQLNAKTTSSSCFCSEHTAAALVAAPQPGTEDAPAVAATTLTRTLNSDSDGSSDGLQHTTEHKQPSTTKQPSAGQCDPSQIPLPTLLLGRRLNTVATNNTQLRQATVHNARVSGSSKDSQSKPPPSGALQQQHFSLSLFNPTAVTPTAAGATAAATSHSMFGSGSALPLAHHIGSSVATRGTAGLDFTSATSRTTATATMLGGNIGLGHSWRLGVTPASPTATTTAFKPTALPAVSKRTPGAVGCHRYSHPPAASALQQQQQQHEAGAHGRSSVIPSELFAAVRPCSEASAVVGCKRHITAHHATSACDDCTTESVVGGGGVMQLFAGPSSGDVSVVAGVDFGSHLAALRECAAGASNRLLLLGAL